MSEEAKELNFCKNNVSMKRELIVAAEAYSRILNEKFPSKDGICELVLLTDCGIICGEPATVEEYQVKDVASIEKNGSGKINLFSVGYQRDEILKAMENENPDLKAIDNGSYICLKNATTVIDNRKQEFAELIVFADRVTGISLRRKAQ